MGEVSSNEYTIQSGDEVQIGDEGYMGHSDGATQTGIQSDAIIPVKGMEKKLEMSLLRKEYVQIGLGVVNGKVHTITMRVVEAVFTGAAANGTQTGRFRFEGGAPQIAG